jgi:stress response protein YsnF
MQTEPSVTPGPEVVLHAERLDVGMERDVVRAVVRRRVVAETQQVEVTVRREVLEVEYLPVDPGELGDAPPGERAPVVLVLSEEVPVVTTAVRPYERVVVDVVTRQQTETVKAVVGHEQVDIRT